MGNEIKNTVILTGPEAQYDMQAKSLLGYKSILARILVQTVDEFLGMEPKAVEELIEEAPKIGLVPVDGGMTNIRNVEKGIRITGMNTENYEMNEGMIRFDVLFHVCTKDGTSRIIVDVEAQKDEPTSYDIMNRSSYYGGRLLSSQKDREFTNSNYNDIKRVFSIWICMNQEECVMNHIYMEDNKMIGNRQWKGKDRIMNLILIGLPKKVPDKAEGMPLHRMLCVLFSMDMFPEEKLRILEEEFQIEMKENIRKEMEDMCNLGRGVFEKGIEQGIEQGIERGIEIGSEREKKQVLQNLMNLGVSMDVLTAAVDMNEKEVVALMQG